MRKLFYILALGLSCVACVGQKDDPEPEPEPVVDPIPDPDPEPEPEPEPESGVFYRRVLALEFTAMWCQHCPDMAEALEEASAAREDRIVTLAAHYQDPPLNTSESDALSTLFKIIGYPTLIMDWDPNAKTTEHDTDWITHYVDSALEKEVCGLAAESAVQDGTLNVTARVTSVSEAAYACVLALVEDGIKLNDPYGYFGSNFVYNDVFQRFLDCDAEGKSLGTLAQEEEGMVTFTATAPEKGRLVLFVKADGKVQNAITLALNETKDYSYEKVTP